MGKRLHFIATGLVVITSLYLGDVATSAPIVGNMIVENRLIQRRAEEKISGQQVNRERFDVEFALSTLASVALLVDVPQQDPIAEDHVISVVQAVDPMGSAQITPGYAQMIPPDQTDRFVIGFSAQRAANDDAVGWINIPGVDLSYPVMYYPDNDYYLKRTPDRVESAYGSIFLDAASGGNWAKVNLLHGHNMRDNRMFGYIGWYRLEDFCSKHRLIQIYDGVNHREYIVFSVFTLDDREEGIQLYYSSDDDFMAQVRAYQSRSMYWYEVPSLVQDILVLNTCYYGPTNQDRNLHTIVVAYRSK